MNTMWMIRADGGNLYDDFRERGIAAIGWTQLAPHVKSGMTRKELAAIYQSIYPEANDWKATLGASQVWRFMHEIKIGDWVVTYSPTNRTYLVGKITGDCQYNPKLEDMGMDACPGCKMGRKGSGAGQPEGNDEACAWLNAHGVRGKKTNRRCTNSLARQPARQ